MAGNRTSGDDQTEFSEKSPVRHARLYWQCRRGMLELDLVLQAFLDHQYHKASVDERRAFETLLNYPDALLFEYIMGREIPTDSQLVHVINQLRSPAPA